MAWQDNLNPSQHEPFKLDEYKQGHDYPMVGIDFVRLGSAHIYVSNLERLIACRKTLANYGAIVNKPYDSRMERHEVIDRHTNERILAERDSLSAADKLNLKEISCCFFISSQPAGAPARYAYIGVMMDRMDGILKQIATENRFNPTDHLAFLLARADGMPRETLREYMIKQYHFGEDCIYCDYKNL
ncbi:hypothetical protein GC177_03420 [bacterium]|nr:hypothetical protein [bacterium]